MVESSQQFDASVNDDDQYGIVILALEGVIDSAQ